MRTPLFVIALTLAALPVAFPAVAAAQEVPGLDLSQPPKPERPAQGEDEELSPIDLSKPASPPASPPARAGAAPAREERPREGAPFSEKDVALGDRVKAVQRKGFLKKGRLELAPVLAVTATDPFFQKFGYGLRFAYHVHDSFALSLRGTKYAKYRADAVRAGQVALRSQLLESAIQEQLMLGGIWSPIYGKAAFRGASIVHFDLYLSAGFGLVWTATSEPPLEQGVDVPVFERPAKIATDFGGGVRFYPKEWLAFELGLNATLYPDQINTLLPATTQKVFAANVGVSFFWPTTFDYVYP